MAERARYRVTAPSFIDGRVITSDDVERGIEVEFDHEPGHNLEPVNDAARAAKKQVEDREKLPKPGDRNYFAVDPIQQQRTEHLDRREADLRAREEEIRRREEAVARRAPADPAGTTVSPARPASDGSLMENRGERPGEPSQQPLPGHPMPDQPEETKPDPKEAGEHSDHRDRHARGKR